MTLADIGAELMKARQEHRLTQDQLASSLGMSRATISAIEGGRCIEIGFTKLAALLELVGLELRTVDRRRPTIDDLREERRR